MSRVGLMRTAAQALGVMFLSMAAQANAQVYTATLSGAAESPPNASPGTGTAIVTLNLDLSTMRVQANFSGLTGTATAAHLHGPTAVAGTGVAGVMTQTPTFPGFPIGVTTGSYDQTFDLTLASSYNATFVSAQGGVANARNALVASIQDGKAYFNLHTTTFGGGEIRGFLVPEPATLGLLATAGMIGLRRRRA
jgi:hypothetical protein